MLNNIWLWSKSQGEIEHCQSSINWSSLSGPDRHSKYNIQIITICDSSKISIHKYMLDDNYQNMCKDALKQHTYDDGLVNSTGFI